MSAQSTYRTHAEALASQLSLPFGAQRWSGLAGEFAGRGTGASMDFQDHRDYAPGDDPRHINWAAYARSGNYILKQYQEEVAPTVDLILDLSPSMFFTEAKAQRSSELLYLLSASAQQRGAQLSVHLIAGDHYLPVTTEEVHSTHWTRHLQDTIAPSHAIPPRIDRIPLHSGSMRVLISDLLYEGDPGQILHPLQHQGGSLLCFAPYLQSEMNPDWKGNYEFEDAETAARSSYRIDSAALDRYRTAYRRHFSLWEQSVRAAAGQLARVSADTTLQDALAQEAIPRKLLDYSR